MKSSADDLRKAYKRDLSKVKPKTRISKMALQQMVTDEHWHRLTEIMLPYALQLAHNYQALTATAGLDFMDLVQEASIATMKAVKAWDPERGSALTTLVKFYIKSRFNRLSKGFSDQTISLDQLAESAGVGEASMVWQLQEIMTDESGDPEELYIYLQALERLDMDSDKLPDRQRAAVRAFCGLDNGTPLTLAEVASELGISSPAAKKLLTKGLTIVD